MVEILLLYSGYIYNTVVAVVAVVVGVISCYIDAILGTVTAFTTGNHLQCIYLDRTNKYLKTDNFFIFWINLKLLESGQLYRLMVLL